MEPLLTFENSCYEWTLIRWIKTPTHQVIPSDYEQKSQLDINAKKLDKVRQPDETSLRKTAKKLDKKVRQGYNWIAENPWYN